MTGKLSKNFHGVGIGPLSNIVAVKYFAGKEIDQDMKIAFDETIL